MLVALLLAGCRPSCEPEVVGGSEEERARVTEAALSFLDLLRPEYSVCVPKVRIVDEIPRKEIAGQYSRVSHNVVLVETRPHVVHHELCHALAGQNGLEFEDPRWVMSPAHQSATSRPPREQPEESFALACEFGPNWAFFFDDVCPGDDEGVSVYREVSDLFVGPDASVELDPGVVFVPTVHLATDASAFELRVMSTGVVVELPGASLALDPWTGLEVVPDASSTRATGFASLGDETFILLLFEAANGAEGLRRVLLNGGVSSYLGCPQPHEKIFPFDGVFWSAFLDNGQVTLGYYAAET